MGRPTYRAKLRAKRVLLAANREQALMQTWGHPSYWPTARFLRGFRPRTVGGYSIVPTRAKYESLVSLSVVEGTGLQHRPLFRAKVKVVAAQPGAEATNEGKLPNPAQELHVRGKTGPYCAIMGLQGSNRKFRKIDEAKKAFDTPLANLLVREVVHQARTQNLAGVLMLRPEHNGMMLQGPRYASLIPAQRGERRLSINKQYYAAAKSHGFREVPGSPFLWLDFDAKQKKKPTEDKHRGPRMPTYVRVSPEIQLRARRSRSGRFITYSPAFKQLAARNRGALTRAFKLVEQNLWQLRRGQVLADERTGLRIERGATGSSRGIGSMVTLKVSLPKEKPLFVKVVDKDTEGALLAPSCTRTGGLPRRTMPCRASRCASSSPRRRTTQKITHSWFPPFSTKAGFKWCWTCRPQSEWRSRMPSTKWRRASKATIR